MGSSIWVILSSTFRTSSDSSPYLTLCESEHMVSPFSRTLSEKLQCMTSLIDKLILMSPKYCWLNFHHICTTTSTTNVVLAWPRQVLIFKVVYIFEVVFILKDVFISDVIFNFEVSLIFEFICNFEDVFIFEVIFILEVLFILKLSSFLGTSSFFRASSF